MTLRNADGTVAEMSGNGIRCLAQAVFQAGLVALPVLRVATAAGLRTVTLVSQTSPDHHRMSVEMGAAKVLGPEPELVGGDVLRASRVDVGNPHVVLLWGGAALPDVDHLIALGSRIDAAAADGANVEVVLPGPAVDELLLVVYERGVGPTRACGTGACAAAAAANQWGLAGERSIVHMPGGPAEIALGDPVLLTGDTRSVAVIDTPWP